LGSLERFVACLTEHYMGDFPLWLAPEQARVIPIKEDFTGYGLEVKGALLDSGIRAEIDSRNETLNKRIRQAEVEKVPYILIVGQREAEAKTVTVRKRHVKDQQSLSVSELIEKLKDEINKKTA
jgi:threonyl-tRNA synthetase